MFVCVSVIVANPVCFPEGHIEASLVSGGALLPGWCPVVCVRVRARARARA